MIVRDSAPIGVRRIRPLRYAAQPAWRGIAPHVTGANSPNYYWAFVGLIVVAGVAYALVARRMPVKDFITPDVMPAPA